ncbi:DVU_1556 family methyltransferase [Clostridium estertheticum]|uniref:DVU_1556 family methyltransferase n=1 Tax=Clostridium estertheticum TaxID=238834 RepID=UPI001C0D1FEC|nr:class I SAM-dependent methyltransferase [Clostridium estertheticum]MBU3075720.1 class I SAM-dependent methyltransferase [Clostridium estertheticum]MBU3165832.1 class I SAM-dependent methyltransferase [Clostridium estertheticum]MBU3173473.1 class I SAM-dependent methyltransferase [Clostridium estertheticum]
MKGCSVFENEDMIRATGDTLRPGGVFLTDRAVKICDFKFNDKILDVGCGMGVTVERLKRLYKLNAFGVDPSLKLLELGKDKYGNHQIDFGRGEKLPHKNEFFKGVMAECTMSLMDDFEETIRESYRVLENDGYFIVSDVYARRPEYLEEVQKHDINSCMRGLFNVDILKDVIVSVGFEIICFEDWTDLLRQLMVEIIFKYGSMAKFWEVATCNSCGDFQEKLTLCKPGYFLIIAKKK